MARKPTGNKNGRPKTIINKEEFEKLCGMQCTLVEMCGWFNCCHNTIEDWCLETYGDGFSNIFKIKSGVGKISLRRSQFKLAEKSAAMAIFLGKQYLEQRDELKNNNDSLSDNVKININIKDCGGLSNDE